MAPVGLVLQGLQGVLQFLVGPHSISLGRGNPESEVCSGSLGEGAEPGSEPWFHRNPLFTIFGMRGILKSCHLPPWRRELQGWRKPLLEAALGIWGTSTQGDS